MAIRPTFYGFEMARSALSASQRKIDVTGQNIANINTEGFSRQRVNVSAVGAGGLNWKYPVHPSQNVGLGVNIDSVARVRDQFLDVRFRTETGHVERFNVIDDALTSVENLLDEFVMENLYSTLTDFMNALQNFHRESDEVEFASLMRSAAMQLTSTLNKIAHDMDDIVEMQLMQMDLLQINFNNITRQLDAVNHEIRTQHLFNPMSVSNELLDKRDLLLDQLAMFGEVTVVHDNSGPFDAFGNGTPTGGLWIFFGEVSLSDIDSTDAASMLGQTGLLVRGDSRGYSTIDFDIQEARETIAERSPGERGDSIRFTWGASFPDPPGIPLGTEGEPVIAKTGQIFGYYEMMNGIGDITASDDELDLATKGIPFFRDIVEVFTQVFVSVFTEFNEDGEPGDGGFGGSLFAANDGGELSARNITIVSDWLVDPTFIVRFFQGETIGADLSGDHETPADSRNDNLLRMIAALRGENTSFEMQNGNIFQGSFQQFIGMLNTEIAIEIDFNNKRLVMSDILLMSVDQMRESIKGISEDEEAMNLARYQKSYNAAARFMTVLDEMLEIIVMRMGIVGR
jgi:flagellar hook-associated protein 1 FlgK